MNKAEIQIVITAAEQQLNDTTEAAAHGRGVLNDVVNLVVPMQLTQLKILRAIAENLPD